MKEWIFWKQLSASDDAPIVLYNHEVDKRTDRAILEKSPKNIFRHLVPYNPVSIIGSEKLPCEIWGFMVYYLRAKNKENTPLDENGSLTIN